MRFAIMDVVSWYPRVFSRCGRDEKKKKKKRRAAVRSLAYESYGRLSVEGIRLWHLGPNRRLHPGGLRRPLRARTRSMSCLLWHPRAKRM